MAYGQEPAFLQLLDTPLPHMKSVGRSMTGYNLCSSEAEIKKILYNLTAEVIYKVRAMGLAGRHVALYLQGSLQGSSQSHAGKPAPSYRQSVTLQYYLNHTQTMFEILYYQLYANWVKKFPIIKFGVRLSMLKPLKALTQPLLPAWQQREKIAQAQDQINQKYGLFTLKSGILLKHQIIRPEVTGFFGDKDFQLIS
jgi:hypothetical protein